MFASPLTQTKIKRLQEVPGVIEQKRRIVL